MGRFSRLTDTVFHPQDDPVHDDIIIATDDEDVGGDDGFGDAETYGGFFGALGDVAWNVATSAVKGAAKGLKKSLGFGNKRSRPVAAQQKAALQRSTAQIRDSRVFVAGREMTVANLIRAHSNQRMEMARVGAKLSSLNRSLSSERGLRRRAQSDAKEGEKKAMLYGVGGLVVGAVGGRATAPK